MFKDYDRMSRLEDELRHTIIYRDKLRETLLRVFLAFNGDGVKRHKLSREQIRVLNEIAQRVTVEINAQLD